METCFIQDADVTGLYTAVSTMVVQIKHKSVRDNAERWSGKYPINFNKSSESITPRPYSEELR